MKVLVSTVLLLISASSAIECPKYSDPRKVVHLPHESDCTSFYKCSFGKKYLMRCPSDLHFNSRLEVCDYSWSAGCNLIEWDTSSTPETISVQAEETRPSWIPTESTIPTGTYGTTLSSSTTESTIPTVPTETTIPTIPTESTTSTTTSTTPKPAIPSSCADVDPHKVIYIPHECVCSKFYSCENGRAMLEECPAFLHFNYAAQDCDFPEDAGCA